MIVDTLAFNDGVLAQVALRTIGESSSRAGAFAQLLGNYGEFFGAIAVVVSLVYLALQLRLNTKAIKANASWDSEVIYGNANLELSRDPEVALLVSRANNISASASDFNETEMAQLYFSVRSALQFAQAQWWLWRSGNLPDELWEYRSRWARNFVESPVMNAIWQAELEQHIFSAQFVNEILNTEQQGELAISTKHD